MPLDDAPCLLTLSQQRHIEKAARDACQLRIFRRLETGLAVPYRFVAITVGSHVWTQPFHEIHRSVPRLQGATGTVKVIVHHIVVRLRVLCIPLGQPVCCVLIGMCGLFAGPVTISGAESSKAEFSRRIGGTDDGSCLLQPRGVGLSLERIEKLPGVRLVPHLIVGEFPLVPGDECLHIRVVIIPVRWEAEPHRHLVSVGN